jgi:hypothetical protein
MSKMSKFHLHTMRIVIGLVLTIALLGLARRLSTRRPYDIAVDVSDLRAQHTTVTEQVGPGAPLVSVTVEPEEGIEPVVLCRDGVGVPSYRLDMIRSGEGSWEVALPARDKGERLSYALSILREGAAVARIPEDEGSFILVKYKGEVSPAVLILHVIFMFAAFFFMVQSLWSAVGILRGTERKAGAVSYARWVLICSFIGGWPLGFLLNYQAFGYLWEGYPFGYDITDNKTQVMFVFWLVSLLLVRGSFLGRSEESDRLGARSFAAAVMVSFAVSLLLFIVPHSL